MALPSTVPRYEIPDSTGPGFNFLDSSYFKGHTGRSLPSPSEVKALSTFQGNRPRHRPVVFRELGLFVKFGVHITVKEAHTLWAVRRIVGPSVPVPEVFGWRRYGHEVFIYMEFIPGLALRDIWPAMTRQQKEDTAAQLQVFMRALREVEQDPSDRFIGSLDGGSLPDNAFEFQHQAGPFPSAKRFNDWFALLPMKNLPEQDRYPHPARQYLPDDGKITLTHADLHSGNIMMSDRHPSKVIAIVDWEQAGWYPDYWEYCKCCHTSHYESDWRLEYLPRILETRDEEFFSYAQFIDAMGAYL